jgi:hypothetical protein
MGPSNLRVDGVVHIICIANVAVPELDIEDVMALDLRLSASQSTSLTRPGKRTTNVDSIVADWRGDDKHIATPCGSSSSTHIRTFSTKIKNVCWEEKGVERVSFIYSGIDPFANLLWSSVWDQPYIGLRVSPVPLNDRNYGTTIKPN